MRSTRLLSRACLALALSACFYAPLGKKLTELEPGSVETQGDAATSPVGQRSSDWGTALIKLEIQDGTYRSQAVIEPYVKPSISHVLLKLYKIEGADEVAAEGRMADLAAADLAKPVAFSGLPGKAVYRVKAYAFTPNGSFIETLISTDSAAVDVTLTPGATVSATLPLELVDRLFDGQGSPSFNITPGKLIDPASEEIQ